MTKLSKLFVVYDPTRSDQPALERASQVAADVSASLHVFACIYADIGKVADKSAEVSQRIAQQQEELAKAVAPLVEQGLDVTLEVEWEKDWPQAAVRASIKSGAEIVLKSSFKHSLSKRMLSRTSDFTLIRECLVPVLLVKESPAEGVPLVLAAIDICAKNELYVRLNQNVIEFSRHILDNHQAEVHFINAFRDFKGVPDRQELVKNCGIDSDRIHIKLGEPDKVIVEQARKMNASLVVVGNSSRTGLSAALLGNTVEKILDRLECDVLSMP